MKNSSEGLHSLGLAPTIILCSDLQDRARRWNKSDTLCRRDLLFLRFPHLPRDFGHQFGFQVGQDTIDEVGDFAAFGFGCRASIRLRLRLRLAAVFFEFRHGVGHVSTELRITELRTDDLRTDDRLAYLLPVRPGCGEFRFALPCTEVRAGGALSEGSAAGPVCDMASDSTVTPATFGLGLAEAAAA